ncbi:MAG: ArdC-like ssDNA-binding domain-containing protein [Bryobacteraceae bacterium]
MRYVLVALPRLERGSRLDYRAGEGGRIVKRLLFSEAAGRRDFRTRVTNRIVADLDTDVRPWTGRRNVGGRILRPLRHNGFPYSGINVLMPWGSAMAREFSSPMWMTCNRATDLRSHVRKGEKGSLAVYADTIAKTERTGERPDVEREIPFMKAGTEHSDLGAQSHRRSFRDGGIERSIQRISARRSTCYGILYASHGSLCWVID